MLVHTKSTKTQCHSLLLTPRVLAGSSLGLSSLAGGSSSSESLESFTRVKECVSVANENLKRMYNDFHWLTEKKFITFYNSYNS